MECPKCGFVMDPFSTECPRCARMKGEASASTSTMRPSSPPIPSDKVVPPAMRSSVAPMQRVPMRQPQPVQGVDSAVSLSMKQLLGIIGALLMLLGIFLPIVKIPVIGNINYWQVSSTVRSVERIADSFAKTQNSFGNSSMSPESSSSSTGSDQPKKLNHDMTYFEVVYGPMLLLLIAAISLYLAWSNNCTGLFATGGVSLALMGSLVFAGVRAMGKMTQQMKGSDTSMVSQMSSSMFGGKSISDLFGIHWLGAIVLLAAAVVLIVSAALPAERA